MLNKYLRIAGLAAVVLLFGIAGCATDQSARKAKKSIEDADIIASSHTAVVALVKQAEKELDGPLIVASLANIDNLDGSSSFGRIVAQQFASGFSKAGYNVIELLLRNNVYIKQGNGEFLLSRKIKNLSAQHNVQAVVVGTYAVGAERVYVTAKLVGAADSVVMASYDFALPLGPDTKNLLRK